jgi:hypothetical protein
MTSPALPKRVIGAEPATIQVLKHLFNELEEIIKATEAGPELAFVPLCPLRRC